MLEDEAHAHHGHTGVRWMDVLLASSAVLISVISLAVSINHGKTMERLVEENALQVRASTLPILRVWSGNFLENDKQAAVHFDVANGGTGPAIIDWFEVRYDGRALASASALLDACCRVAGERGPRALGNRISGQLVAPNQSLHALVVWPGQGDPAIYHRLEEEGRYKVSTRACFCSVLNQCWITRSFQARSQPVKDCASVKPAVVW